MWSFGQQGAEMPGRLRPTQANATFDRRDRDGSFDHYEAHNGGGIIMRRFIAIGLCLAVSAAGLAGCSTREVVAGAAAGGAAYEYSNKRAMDALREDYREGRITREEYERRKDEIEQRSLVY